MKPYCIMHTFKVCFSIRQFILNIFLNRDREFLLEALVNFGFTLLSVSFALGRDAIVEKQWILGTMILLKIIKKRRNVASIVLKTFCNHILTRNSATQYIGKFNYLKSFKCSRSFVNYCAVEIFQN